jgi:Protein of unknown function (DUF3489)
MFKSVNRRTAKPAKERSRNAAAARSITAQPSLPEKTTTSNDRKEKDGQSSKQARVVEMLNSPTGTTIAAVMKATGWQQHSVRGFFAGVVRKKLRLKLTSKKVDGNRIYLIADAGSVRSKSRQPSHHSA